MINKNILLEISNLEVKVQNEMLLKSINLKLKKGDVLAIIGPNGAGKSTFFKAIMSHYAYKKTKGSIKLNNKDVTNLKTEQLVKNGLFYLSQNPIELEGIKLIDLYKSINDINNKNTSTMDLYNNISEAFKQYNLHLNLLKRQANVNFSGGQKKKNELIQMNILPSDILLLDEIDSGCDVDSIKTIAKNLNKIKKDKIILLISHQKQLLDLIKPNKFVIFANKTIAKAGLGKDLNKQLSSGFNQYIKNNKSINKIDTLKDAF